MSCNEVEKQKPGSERDLDQIEWILAVHANLGVMSAFERVKWELRQLQAMTARQAKEIAAHCKARISCEEENKRLQVQNTELCATVQRQMTIPRPTIEYTYVPGCPPPALHNEVASLRENNSHLLGKVAGLERAVNALTEVGKGVVESKNPDPCAGTVTKVRCADVAEELARGQFDRGWNAALDAVIATPTDKIAASFHSQQGWVASVSAILNVLNSLKKKVPC
jgi:hypothetical protein